MEWLAPPARGRVDDGQIRDEDPSELESWIGFPILLLSPPLHAESISGLVEETAAGDLARQCGTPTGQGSGETHSPCDRSAILVAASKAASGNDSHTTTRKWMLQRQYRSCWEVYRPRFLLRPSRTRSASRGEATRFLVNRIFYMTLLSLSSKIFPNRPTFRVASSHDG